LVTAVRCTLPETGTGGMIITQTGRLSALPILGGVTLSKYRDTGFVLTQVARRLERLTTDGAQRVYDFLCSV
jgi:hypothetical protein